MRKDPTNTLYVAAKRLSLPGEGLAAIPGSGVFEYVDDAWRLTARSAAPLFGVAPWHLDVASKLQFSFTTSLSSRSTS